MQMKNYLEKNAGLNGIQVIPLSISDRKALLNEVNRLREEHEIRCVIGTYDPGLHGIPFISVVKLFETPADKLDMLLTIPESDHTPVNYEMIFSYLSSQMPALDIKKLRKSLPRALAKIKRISAEGLDQNQELGVKGMKGCSSLRALSSTYTSTRRAVSACSASPEFRRGFAISMNQSQ